MGLLVGGPLLLAATIVAPHLVPAGLLLLLAAPMVLMRRRWREVS